MNNRIKSILCTGISLLSLSGIVAFLGYREDKAIESVIPVVSRLYEGKHFVSGTPWDSYENQILMLEYLSQYRGNYPKEYSLFRESLINEGYDVSKLEREVESMRRDIEVYGSKEFGKRKIAGFLRRTHYNNLRKLIKDYLMEK